jgi:pimeloyl-ACP methyl ester carboxylesterase
MDTMDQRLRWKSVLVQGRDASFAVAGLGDPVVFVHGWGLSQRSYRAALDRLVRSGALVYAPALPGFGGTAPLPRAELSMAGYAQWLQDFLDALAVPQPVTLIGHSFGGGVALKTAHDHPRAVSRLVLVNSVGGSVWKADKSMHDRPLWDWGLHLSVDALSPRGLTKVVPVVARDAVTNAVQHPHVLWAVGRLARDANLEAELAEVRRRRLPVFVLWGRNDRVIPLASAEALIGTAEGAQLQTVPGDHGWLICDPDRFAEVLTNVITSRDDPSAAVGF